MKRISIHIVLWAFIALAYILGYRTGHKTAPTQQLPFDTRVIKIPVGEGICNNWKPGDSYARIQGNPPSETGTGRWLVKWYECVQLTKES